MIIMCQCEAETKETLDRLVKGGRYGTASETIAAAIRTLEMLDNASEGKAVFLDEQGSILSQLSVDHRDVLPSSDEQTRTNSKTKPATRAKPKPEVPEIFQLAKLKRKPPLKLAGLPSDVWRIGQRIPIKRWIFGQCNKLLPAKASARAMANLTLEERADLRLPQVPARLAEAAGELGVYLHWLDKQRGYKREVALATGFPGTSQGQEKGRLRYANQFVASLNGRGEVSGLLVDLKLASIEREKDDVRIRLTEVGWDFAAEPNPILDGERARNENRFSEKEIKLLLSHIATSVPVEAFAWFAILSSIREGHRTPTDVDNFLNRYRKDSVDEQISDDYVSTQRSGAVSRACDLGLLRRIRSGVRISYELTERGGEYLDRLMRDYGEVPRNE